MTQMENVSPKEVGMALFGPYLLGVEMASVLLLAGLVGAYHLAYHLGRRREERGRREIRPMNGIPVEHGLIVAASSLRWVSTGVLIRRDILFILLSLEIMLNAAGLAFIAAGSRWAPARRAGDVHLYPGRGGSGGVRRSGPGSLDLFLAQDARRGLRQQDERLRCLSLLWLIPAPSLCRVHHPGTCGFPPAAARSRLPSAPASVGLSAVAGRS